MSRLETKKKGSRIIFDVIVLVEREVGVIVAEVYALYMDGAVVRICLLLVKSSVLKGVQRNPYNFSKRLFWLERSNKFSLVSI